MTNLLFVGLTNAVLASALAVIVLCITRIWKNPHLAHGLWLLVLLKLLSPPLLNIPVSIPGAQPSEGLARVADRAADLISSTRVDPGDMLATVPNVSQQQALTVRESPSERSTVETPRSAGTAWPHLVAAVWLAGSLIWASVVAWRVWGFQRMLRHAEPPSRRLRHLAETVRVAMGLKICPVLHVVDGRLPPLVWPVGRKPRVVLPRPIVERFQEDELQAILAHEFAHLVRRDPWVRWLELVVGLVYWWHPVLWWARKQIRFAEEACCDALVVRRFGRGNPDTYASALLKVVEFSTGLLDPVPSVASGLAAKGRLQRRIEMMVQGEMKQRLPIPGKVGLVALALFALPLSASAWQQEKATQEKVASGAGTDQGKSAQEVLDAKTGESADQEAERETTAGAIDQDVPSPLTAGSEQDVRVRPGSLVERPKGPYRIAPRDVLKVRVLNAFEEAPIDKKYRVGPSGSVDLGAPYGSVKIEGLTLHQAEQVITDHLAKVLAKPIVSAMFGYRDDAIPKADRASSPGAEAASELLSKLLLIASESQMTESVGILQEKVRRSRALAQQLQTLYEKNAVPQPKVEEAFAEYQLSKLRLLQGERALRTRLLAAEFAEIEYQRALETNQRVAGTIPDLEVERLRLLVELAKAKASELAE